MNNGSNDWDVPFSRISWLEEVLKNHLNVVDVVRHDDIVFEIQRKQGPSVTLLCLDEYTLGVAAAERVFREFPHVNLIYVGGKWNNYTADAKELCRQRSIGLYNADELNGALRKKDFTTYYQRDKNRGSVDQRRSSRT